MLVFNPSKLSRKAMLAVMYVLITTRLFNYSFSPNKNELLCVSLLIQLQMKKKMELKSEALDKSFQCRPSHTIASASTVN